jgi:hypothetical protein
MNPSVAAADHMATPPRNSVQFEVAYAGGTCAIPLIAYLPAMTSSDPADVSVPSPGGVAVCIGATNGAAVLTDTRSQATALLTCK